MKTAIITGANGQDGSYLAELLLSKDYFVVGVIRRSSSNNLDRLKHCVNNKNFILEYGDVTDPHSISNLVIKYKPNEFYNLAAQSFVQTSFEQPHLTSQITGLGVLNCLDAIKNHSKETKFYQAGSSEMFGKVQETPQTEKTPFYPRSPYGVAKCFGHQITVNYRESYGLFACNGILFNHESSRRGLEFVTRKITNAAARIVLKKQQTLELGNLEAKRDWSHAKDMVYGMWLMLQQNEPDDYVLSSNETHTVKEFVKLAFEYFELDWEKHVVISPKYFRPAEVDLLLGDSTKARTKLGWEPKYNFEKLIEEMCKSDLFNDKD